MGPLRHGRGPGKTVGFVGYGHIAQQTAVLCKALGMRIIACRRSSGGEDVVAPSQTYAPAGSTEALR